MALVEVDAFSTLLHVRAPLGRSAEKAVGLPPPCFVWTCSTGCTDDTVLLGPPGTMGTSTALPAVHLQLPMLTNPRRPRTTFHTIRLLPVSPTPCLSMRTPQMLMTLRTLRRTRSMFARSSWHFLFSYPTLCPFLLFPKTRYQPQTVAHQCTVLFYTSCYLPLPSTYSLPPAHTRLPTTAHETQTKARKEFAFFLIIPIHILILIPNLFHTIPLNV